MTILVGIFLENSSRISSHHERIMVGTVLNNSVTEEWSSEIHSISS